MPKYKLGIASSKDVKIIESKIISNEIDELDKFTSKFEDEEELKTNLLCQGLMSESEVSEKIKVYYQNNHKLKHIPIMYKQEYRYIDPYYLAFNIKSKCNDFKFLEELANHFDNGKTSYNKQGLNVSDIRVYLSNVRQNDGIHFESKLLNNALDNLIFLAINKFDSKTSNYKKNYRGLRDLALFVYRYDLKLESKRLKQMMRKDEPTKEDVIYPIFSYSINWDHKQLDSNKDDSDEEPIFPPNSEEEKQYLEYLDDLEKSSQKKYHI